MRYDEDGRMIQVWDGELDTGTIRTSYDYDAQTGLLVSIDDPATSGDPTLFTYNAAGQVETMDDPLISSDEVSTWGYDSAGRMSTRVDDQADLAWTRTYEANTGRVDTETIEKDSTSATLAAFDLGYDKASNVTSKDSEVLSNPSNGSWTYSYDAAGRMTEADGPDATGTATTWTYGWDGASNRISVQIDSNTPVETTYNGAGDPVSDTDGNDFTTDGVGNLVAMENTSDPSKNWTYDYDPFSRLVCAENDTSCSGSGAITFALDALDRAVSRTKDSTTTTYRYRGVGEVPAKTTTGGTSTRYANTLAGEPIAQRTGSTTRFS